MTTLRRDLKAVTSSAFPVAIARRMSGKLKARAEVLGDDESING